MLGSVFLHLAVDSSSTDIRRSTLATLSLQTSKHPELVNHLVSLALVSRLTREKSTLTKPVAPSEEGEVKILNTETRLCAFLLTCAAFGPDLDNSIREILLVNLVVLGHHPAVGKQLVYTILLIPDLKYNYIVGTGSRLPWIELCQTASIDPQELVEAYIDSLLPKVLEASQVRLHLSVMIGY